MNVPSLLSATTAATNSVSEAIHKTTLDQDDFLKLLITQMTSQDPLNPVKDTEFIAQLAQFSTLEQSKNMQSDIAALRSDQQLLQANSLLGRTVILNLDDQTQAMGVVSAVQMEAGTPRIVVNGMSYELNQLALITPTIAGS